MLEPWKNVTNRSFLKVLLLKFLEACILLISSHEFFFHSNDTFFSAVIAHYLFVFKEHAWFIFDACHTYNLCSSDAQSGRQSTLTSGGSHINWFMLVSRLHDVFMIFSFLVWLAMWFRWSLYMRKVQTNRVWMKPEFYWYRALSTCMFICFRLLL